MMTNRKLYRKYVLKLIAKNKTTNNLIYNNLCSKMTYFVKGLVNQLLDE